VVTVTSKVFSNDHCRRTVSSRSGRPHGSITTAAMEEF
jgi:hypothetical protein